MRVKSVIAGTLAGAIGTGALVYTDKQRPFNEPHTHTALVTTIDEGRSGALVFARAIMR